MASHNRILNITRDLRWKLKRADKELEKYSCVWVEFGKTVRDTTLEEANQMRNEQAQVRKITDPLPHVEVRGVKFEGPSPLKPSWDLIRQADAWCLGAAV